MAELRVEGTALADDLRAIQGRHATDLASLARLEADHAVLTDERSRVGTELEGVGERYRAALAREQKLEASLDEACRASDEQAADMVVLRSAVEDGRRAHQELVEEHGGERDEAQALRARYDDLLRQRGEAVEALRTALARLQ